MGTFVNLHAIEQTRLRRQVASMVWGARSLVSTQAIGELFFELDGNLDGFITEKEFRDNFDKCSDRLCEAMCESSLRCPERRTSIKRHVVGTMHQITPTGSVSPTHRSLESPE